MNVSELKQKQNIQHPIINCSTFCLNLSGKKKKLEAAEAEKQGEEENNTENKQAGDEAYDPTEATDDADIEEDGKNEDVDMEGGMCLANIQFILNATMHFH